MPRIQHSAEVRELTAHPGSGYGGNPSFPAAIADDEQIFVQVEFFEHSLALRKKCGNCDELTFRNYASIPWTEIWTRHEMA